MGGEREEGSGIETWLKERTNENFRVILGEVLYNYSDDDVDGRHCLAMFR